MTHEHNIVDTDQRFIIDADGKTITSPANGKTVVIQHDLNSEVFTFQIPRHIEGHDMTMSDSIKIHYVNTGSGTSVSNRESNPGIYTVTDIQVDPNDEELAVFTWTLSDRGTKFAGTTRFQIKFECYGDTPGIPSYRWQTKIFSAINVEEGLDNSDVIVEENPDIILEFEERIAALEKQSITDEQLSGALDKYLSENPIKVDGFVPINREIANMDLSADITVEELQEALSTYPVLKFEGVTPSDLINIKGEIGQLLINETRSGTYIYRCYEVIGDMYSWEEVVSDVSLNYEPYGNADNAPTNKAPWGKMVYKDIKGNEALWICVYTDDNRNATWVRIPLVSNIVTEINENATDTQLPSAKSVYSLIGVVETTLDGIIAIQNELIGGDSE